MDEKGEEGRGGCERVREKPRRKGENVLTAGLRQVLAIYRQRPMQDDLDNVP